MTTRIFLLKYTITKELCMDIHTLYLESLVPKVTDTVRELRRNTIFDRILLNGKLQPDPWSNEGMQHAQLEDSDIKV